MICPKVRILRGMKEEKDKGAREIAWELFERTGNFSYYMLYKRLK